RARAEVADAVRARQGGGVQQHAGGALVEVDGHDFCLRTTSARAGRCRDWVRTVSGKTAACSSRLESSASCQKPAGRRKSSARSSPLKITSSAGSTGGAAVGG